MISSALVLLAWVSAVSAIAHIAVKAKVDDHDGEDHIALLQGQVKPIRNDRGLQGEMKSPNKAAADALEPTTSLDVGADLLSGCVDAYANGLDQVVAGLSRRVSGYPFKASSTSNRSVVFGAGSGTTGTSSLAAALIQMGLTTAHHIELEPGNYWKWQDSIVQCSDKLVNDYACIDCWRNADYISLPKEVDAAVDLPMDLIFIDLFLTFPNAKWILNTRPSHEWAQSRMQGWGDSVPPLEHPCQVDRVESYSVDQVAQMMDLHNELVRCAVPTERLFEFDLFTDGSNGLMRNLSVFLNLSEPLSLDAQYPTVAYDELIKIGPSR